MCASGCDVRQETDVPDLIPARMLNEFAYCPRLAYLEWVQGEFADNLETFEGRFGHRNVDRGSAAPVPQPDGAGAKGTGSNGDDDAGDLATPAVARPTHHGASSTPATLRSARRGAEPDAPDSANGVEPIHTRSLMLSAPGEGIIAKMDLVDIDSATAVPVDYKRGRVPDVPGGAWEPEQVQLCAQGLILRENGYHCEGGILYFIASRRRVSIAFDEPLVERTRALIRELRETAARQTIPPPLVDSPKCPRCSLVGICLPDETVLFSHKQKSDSPVEVRRLVPARDDALPLYVQDQGVSLGKSGDVLTVKSKQKVLRKVKLLDVSQVCLFGNVQITAQALRELSARGIPLCHFSYGGWFHATTVGMAHKNVELRIAQYATAANAADSLSLARRFVAGKIKNCRTLLRRHLPKDDQQNQGCLKQLARLARSAETAADAPVLLGIEGTAARTYFAGLATLLKGNPQFDFNGRNRRPPRDPVNALLSFVYALLTKEVTLAVYACGFDPMLGFFHQPRYGRPSLALDLTEEFRPLVADSVVLMLINNGEVAPSDFLRRAGGVALTDAGRRSVLAAFERRMDTLITHPIFRYRISYRRILHVQARLLARTVLGEIQEYPGFCTR